MNPRQSNWWIALQASAIVLSILLAFGIEAWWTSREQREEELIVLESLLSDLKRIKSVFETDRAYNLAILESAKKLIRSTTDDSLTLDDREIDRLIGDTWYNNGGREFDSAPLGTLVNGGGLGNITNPVLRDQIASIHQQISSVQHFYDNDVAFHLNTMMPFAIRNANVLQITESIEHSPGSPTTTFDFPKFGVAPGVSHAKLIASIEFQNVLIVRMHRLQDILNIAFVDFGEALDLTIESLKEELDR